METLIIPLVKNKAGNTSDPNNYRPIALVSVCSKIIESVLLRIIDDYISTHDNQFGFKKSHSTDMCIYALKCTIEYYRLHNSPVYSCYLDASKAFDKVNHWKLFKKLIDRNVTLSVVRILIFWYRNQTFIVKWGSLSSSTFTVCNGVRQGGILSPYLFALYVNGLSVELNNSNAGCTINNIFVNHFFYADDMCLVALSAMGLQTLIDIAYKYVLILT